MRAHNARLSTLVAALITGLFAVQFATGRVEVVHAVNPAPLPSSRLEFGLASSPSDLGWMTSSGVPWKY